VARLAGVVLCSVKRIAEEVPVSMWMMPPSERSGGSADPASLRISRKPVVNILEEKPDLPLWRSFAGFERPATRAARPPCTLWWPLFVRNRSIGPEVIGELHERLMELARERGVVQGRKMRVDTTVVETNIHYPTDSALLGDGARVLTRTMKKVEKAAVD